MVNHVIKVKVNSAIKPFSINLQKIINLTGSFVLVSLLSACSQTPANKMSYNPSFLSKDKTELSQNTESNTSNNNQLTNKDKTKNDTQLLNEVERIKPFTFTQKVSKNESPITERFSEDKKIKIAADELALNDFLHYVMGEVLEVNYILGESVKKDDNTLTLNLVDSVSHRKLYSLIEELLAERNYVIRFDDDIYYINEEAGNAAKGQIAYGYGQQIEDIPVTSQQIWQFVPFNYAFNPRLQLSMMDIAKVVIYPDSNQNVLIVKGKRNEIIKAVELFQLFDKPDANKKHISMHKLEFIDTESAITKLSELLKQEGISVGSAKLPGQALTIISLPNINTLTLFANTQDVIQRALFWMKKVDLPEISEEIQYFIYPPQFSRASDLGESLQALLNGGNSNSSVGSGTSAKQQNTRNSQNTAGVIGNVALVIDERSNSLIFQTTGQEYKKLLPLIKRLDVMPKQIMLEMIIAEVKLIDDFKQGVSFSLSNKDKSTVSKGFNLGSASAGVLSYSLSGINGAIDLNLFQSNSLVNILSRPSLLVRDGVSANITVGDDIPTVGAVITDAVNGSRTSVVYRKTGVQLTVTPTINAQGVVIMTIDQKISSSAAGSAAVAGSPIIFERGLTTEVVAESGETIILGGLISEDKKTEDTGVPIFSSLPLIGKLFDGKANSKTQTELVIMVTPRVIESNDEWHVIRNKLRQELELLQILD
ncbi:MAG: general secretion pathway protein D [Alteromonadaceae bacterium]|jgi:general secretion pathway protein D